MPQQVLQSLSYLNNYLFKEVADKEKKDKEKKLNDFVSSATEAFIKSGATAGVNDTENLALSVMKEAAKAGILRESLPYISGLYSMKLPQAKQVDKVREAIAYGNELRKTIKTVAPGLADVPSQYLPKVWENYSKGFKLINTSDSQGRPGVTLLNVYDNLDNGQNSKPRHTFTYGQTTVQKYEDIAKGQILAKTGSSGSSSDDGLKPAEIRQRMQSLYTNSNVKAASILNNLNIKPDTQSGTYTGGANNKLMEILRDPQKSLDKFGITNEPGKDNTAVKIEIPGGGYIDPATGKTVPNVAFVPKQYERAITEWLKVELAAKNYEQQLLNSSQIPGTTNYKDQYMLNRQIQKINTEIADKTIKAILENKDGNISQKKIQAIKYMIAEVTKGTLGKTYDSITMDDYNSMTSEQKNELIQRFMQSIKKQTK